MAMRTLRPPRSGRRTRPRLHRPRRRRWSRRMTPPSPRRPSPSRRPTTVGSTPRRSDADGAPTCQVCSPSGATRPAATTAAGPSRRRRVCCGAFPPTAAGCARPRPISTGLECGAAPAGPVNQTCGRTRRTASCGWRSVHTTPPTTSSTPPPASAGFPTSRLATSTRVRQRSTRTAIPSTTRGRATTSYE